MAAQEVAHSVPGFPQKLREAARDASCWRDGGPLYDQEVVNGPYVVTEDGGVWNVWSNSGVAAVLPTRDAAIARMAFLADEWRARTVRKVYFIGHELKVGSEVKIGVAYEPHKRLSTLQTGYPKSLRVLATVEGGETEEEKLHRRYRHARLRGEWFTITPGMKKLIERVSAKEVM